MTSNRNQKAQCWVLDMLENAETAAALDGYSAEDAFEIGAEAKRLAEILRIAISQPADGKPVYQYRSWRSQQWIDTDLTGLRVAAESGWEVRTLWTAPPAAAHGHVPSVSGIGRDAGHPRALVLYLRSEPTDDDIRAIQEALRGNAAAHGDEAARFERADVIAVLREDLLAMSGDVDPSTGRSEMECLLSSWLKGHDIPVFRNSLYAMRAQGDGGGE